MCHGSEIFDKGAMRIKLCEEVMKMVLAKILESLPGVDIFIDTVAIKGVGGMSVF